jgi:hypothetical protein
MLSIFDDASAQAALDQPLEPNLRTLIADRLSDAAAIGLADQTHIVVVQPGDSEAMLQEELGWSPLVNPRTGERYGSPCFEPYWSWLQDVGGYHELILTVGNFGFAFMILVQDAEGVPADLLAMCRAHAGEGGGCGF